MYINQEVYCYRNKSSVGPWLGELCGVRVEARGKSTFLFNVAIFLRRDAHEYIYFLLHEELHFSSIPNKHKAISVKNYNV